MSDSKYPLCQEAGLYPMGAHYLGNWYVRADDVERMLESATIITGAREPASGLWTFGEQPSQSDTHAARLIAITPLKVDTAESLLRELLDKSFIIGDINKDRARKLLK